VTLAVESQGAGPPLILLHGWAMHSGVWGSLPSALAARFRVHAVDLPGHGASTPVHPYTFETIAAAVAARFERESQPLTLVGWSLGGMVALSWAQSQGARIARLVLVSATPRFVVAPDWPHGMAGDTLRRFGDELDAAYRLTIMRFLTLQLQGTEHGRTALAGLRRHVFERGEPSRQVLRDALAILAATDLRNAVAAIETPTLAIAGDRDTLVPWTAGEWLGDHLPNARFARIGGAAHVPFLSHPGPFADAVHEFLA
jgi:pimeloyl-[acyl-carrier protein] methyl ester esterase